MPTHFLSVDDFTDADYEAIFCESAKIKALWKKTGKTDLARDGFAAPFKALWRDYRRHQIFGAGRGRRVSLLFAQPSTRTTMSFHKAANALGSLVSSLNVEASSVAKGESPLDTACMAALGSDILVVRHKGAGGTLRTIANDIFPKHTEMADVAIINAGEGTDEHPTQALLDVFTIQEQLGRRDVHIGLYGDLKQGRTVHSLVKLAARFGARFSCISPDPDLQMPQEYVSFIRGSGTQVQCVSNIEEVIGDLDVLYVTRLQRESLSDEMHHRYNQKATPYYVTPKLLERLAAKAIVMHPLPRLDELSTECDTDPRAKYFTQAYNGIITRTALLRHCLALS